MPSIKSTIAAATLALVASATLPASAALRFNFLPLPGTSPQALSAFQAAGDRWSSAFTDDITLNIQVGFTPLGPDVLSHAESTWTTANYANLRARLLADRTTPDDARATRSLPTASLPMLLNRTANHPDPKDRLIAYLDDDRDANNTRLRLHTANAKALGLLKPHAKTLDGTIVFGSGYAWDFNPADGIAPDAFDFVGLAAHELAHTLGFVSGIDTLEATATKPLPDHHLTAVTPLDLFRYSAESAATKTTNSTKETKSPGKGAGKKGTAPKSTKSTPAIDFTADPRPKYFSLDAGKTPLAPFAAGALSDGHQASHWAPDAHTGLLDPVFYPGQSLAYSSIDLRALDVIGWDLAPASGTLRDPLGNLGHLSSPLALPSVSLNAIRIPEPGALTSAAVALAALARRRPRTRARARTAD